MFGIGFTEIILIAVLAVVVLGPDKLPQLGKTLARVLSEFNKIKRDFRMTISDIERVGEKAASDIRSEADEVDFDHGSDKEKNDHEDITFVADDIDEVPETFEPEPGEEPRRRRRASKKAVNLEASAASERAAASEKADESGGGRGSLDAEDIKGTSAYAKAEAAVPTPEGTRQAAGVLGAKPITAARSKRRRKPPATRATATETEPTSRVKTSKARSAETGTEKKTATVGRPRRKPRPKKPEKIIKSDNKVAGNDSRTTSGVEVKKPGSKPAPEAVPVVGSGPGPESSDKGEG